MSLIYVATAFTNWRAAEVAHALIVEAGHKPVSSWVKVARELEGDCHKMPIGDPRRATEARTDFDEVDSCDVMIALCLPQGGTGMWFEVGRMSPYVDAGLGRLIFVGPGLERTIFAELYENCANIHEAVRML